MFKNTPLRSGGFRSLRSYKTTEIIYDLTVEFCEKYIDKKSRTTDQMVQAARSGKQNIAEGSRAGTSSPKNEFHLVNVARASQEELLLDYEDFLRQKRLAKWGKNDPRAVAIRNLAYAGDRTAGSTALTTSRTYRTDQTDQSDKTELYRKYLSDPESAANCLICLIHQANYLLDRQLAALRGQYGAETESAEARARRWLAKKEKAEEENDAMVSAVLGPDWKKGIHRKDPNDPSTAFDILTGEPVDPSDRRLRQDR